MFQLSLDCLIVALDVSVKATILAVVMAALLRLMRIADCNVRHRVWMGVLLGMLVMPVLSRVVPGLQLPLPQVFDRLLIAEAELVQERRPVKSPADADFVQTTENQEPTSSPSTNDIPWPSASARFMPGDSPPFDDPRPLDLPTVARDQPITIEEPAVASVPDPGQTPVSPVPPRRPWAAYVVLVLAAIWFSGALMFGVRLIIGLVIARWLVIRSTSMNDAELSLPALECPWIRVPLTVGVVRPTVLLPPSWHEWSVAKLAAVLAHERMHIERGDCAVALLAEVNRCLYWFHPLAWWLRQQLAALAESACDDAVIGSTGDRTSYARHLLEVAAAATQHRGRLTAMGVSMARRSNVEMRILSILDFTRPLSQRLTWTRAAILVALMLPLIALAAALRPTSARPAPGSDEAENPQVAAPGTAIPITGKLIDPEARPIEGANISVKHVYAPRLGDTLDTLLRAWKSSSHEVAEAGVLDSLSPQRIASATTDSQGRFTTPPAASDRIYVLEITGPNIASFVLWVVHREGFDAHPWNESMSSHRHQYDNVPLAGPNFTHVAVPDFKLSGRVLGDDGQPIGGVEVDAGFIARPGPPVVTDAEGRYEVSGMRRGDETLVGFRPRDERLLPRTIPVTARTNEPARTLDVVLKRGITVSGRIVDPVTGKGLRAGVIFAPLPENTYASQPGYDTFDRDGSLRHSDDKGNFSFLAIPGPGALLVQVLDNQAGPKFGDQQLSMYRAARFSNEDRPRIQFYGDDKLQFLTAGDGLQQLARFQAAKYVNFAPGSNPPKQLMQLDRGTTVEVEFVDRAGKPVNDVFASGLTETWPFTAQLTKPRTTVFALGADRPRKLLAIQAERGLAAVTTLTGNEKSPHRITLDTAPSFRGRAVDESGEPLANQDLTVFFDDEITSELYRFCPAQKAILTTDGNGRFAMKPLIPGHPFRISINPGNHSLIARLSDEQRNPQPGQQIDLGDVLFAPQGSNSKLVSAKADPAEKEPASQPQLAADDTFIYAGTVVDPKGVPVAGAEIRLLAWRREPQEGTGPALVVTDNDGKFRFDRRKSDFREGDGFGLYQFAQVVVSKNGFGLGVASALYCETTGKLEAELTDYHREQISRRPEAADRGTIKLTADDVPIQGRIVTTEGQPVAGALVEVLAISEGKNGSLDEWLDHLKKPGGAYWSANGHLHGIIGGGSRIRATREDVFLTTKTNDSGRFTLRGLGRERMAQVMVSAPKIETAMLRVCTRPGEIIKAPMSPNNPDGGQATFYPNQFTHAVGPSQPVEGRITDKKTGQPLAGMIIKANRIPTNPVHGSFEAGYIRTITNAEGRYRLTGLPIGENTLMVLPPEKSRYLIAGIRATTKPEEQPLQRDFSVSQGILVHGRVTDTRTEKPLSGRVEYFAFNNNPHLSEARGFAAVSHSSYYHSDKDGHYEIPVLPGAGILTFNADRHQHYARGAGAEDINGPKTGTNGVFFHTSPHYVTPNNTHLLKGLDLAEEDESLDLDLTLTSGTSFKARLRAADREPLSDYYVYGEQPFGGWHGNHSGESFEVSGYLEDEGRRVMVYHPARNLVGLADITGPAPETVEIELRPGGTVRGRVVDQDGTPLEALSLYSKVFDFYIGKREQSPAVLKDRGEFPTIIDNLAIRTDQDGRFELRGLSPGLKYTAGVTGVESMNGRQYMVERGLIFSGVMLEAGQTKDLGDLKIKAPARDNDKANEQLSKGDQANAAVDDSDAEEKSQTVFGRALGAALNWFQKPTEATNARPKLPPHTYRGRIIDPSGKSIPGVVLRMQPKSRIPLESLLTIEDPPKAITDQDGRFAVELKGEERGYGLLPIMKGYGLGYIYRFADDESDYGDVILQPERPLPGRLLDPEGRSIVGANVSIKYAYEPKGKPNLDEFLTGWKRDESDARAASINHPILGTYLPEATTDDQGRFVIQGTAAEYVYVIEIRAEGFGLTTLWAVNRPGFDARPYNDAREEWRRQWTTPLVAPDFTHICLPDFAIAVRVLDQSGRPVPGARISGELGTWPQQGAATDRQGRYTVRGLPRGQKGYIRVDAPTGMLSQRIEVESSSAQSQIDLDVTLPPGVLVTGRVTDPVTGKGVPGWATYTPLVDNKHADKPGFKDAHFTRETVSENGDFSIVVMPGAGVLSVQAQANGPLQGGERVQIYRTARFSDEDRPHITFHDEKRESFLTPGRIIRHLLSEHSAKYVNFPADTRRQRLDFELDRGQTVDLEFVDADGKPVEKLFISGHTEHATTQLSESRCTIFALATATPRKVIAVAPERNLIGSVTLTGDETSPVRMLLGPSASFRGRAVDEHGQPLAEQNLLVNFDNDDSARYLYCSLPEQNWTITTGKDGGFEFRHAVPKEPIRFAMRVDGGWLETDIPIQTTGLKPGERSDLGSVVFLPYDRIRAMKAKQ